MAPFLDVEQASRHLALIGLDPLQAHFRVIHWNGRGARNLEPDGSIPWPRLERLQAEGFRCFVIAGGGQEKKAVTSIPACFAEWDGLPLGEVVGLLHEAQVRGLPEPTLLLQTWRHGSAHVWWRLAEPCTDIPRWARLMRRFVAALGSDPACTDPSRLMRLAGSTYYAKQGHPLAGTVLGQAEILHEDPEAITTLEELDAWVAAEFARRPELEAYLREAGAAKADPPTDAERQERRGKSLLPPRSLAEIEAALAAIPRRGEPGPNGERTGGPYSWPYHRLVLAGLRDALYRLHKRPEVELDEAAKQQAHREAVEMMEAHSPSRECSWDVAQVAQSSLWLDEGCFWSRARQQGYSLELQKLSPIELTPSTSAQPQQQQGQAAAGERQEAQGQPISADQVADQLRQALREGLDGVALEGLIQQTAHEAKLHPVAVQKILAVVDGEIEARDKASAAVAELGQTAAHDLEMEGFELIEFLPLRIAAALTTVTHGLPYPHPTLAAAYLAGVSGVLPLGSQIMGLPASDYWAPLNLYLGIVGLTGDRKTPLQRGTILRPAEPLQTLLNEAHAAAMQTWEAENAGVKKEDRKPRPFLHRLQLQDFTGEALALRLMEAEKIRRGILIRRDELSGLFRSLDRYRAGGKGGDEEQLLEMYDGDPYSSSRVSAEERFYSRCHLSIAGGIQPQVLRQLMGTRDPQGKFARFLYAPLRDRPTRIPTSLPDGWKAIQEHARGVLSSVLIRAARVHVDPLTGRPDVRMPPLPWDLVLSPPAQERFSDWDLSLQQQKDSYDDDDPRRAVLGKASGHGLRIVGLTHVLRIAEGEAGPDDPVPLAELDRGIAFVEMFQRWVLRFHAQPGSAEGPQMARLVRRVHQIAKRAGGGMTWKEIRDRLKGEEKKGLTSAVGHAAMRALAEAGYGEIREREGKPLAFLARGELPQ